MRWDCKGPVLCHICVCCFFNRGISFPSTSTALLWHWCSAGCHSCNFTGCTHARITKEKLQRTYLQPCELLCFRKVDTGEWWRKWEEKLEKSFLEESPCDNYGQENCCSWSVQGELFEEEICSVFLFWDETHQMFKLSRVLQNSLQSCRALWLVYLNPCVRSLVGSVWSRW